MLSYMDETEIQISHIENIKLIHFYTLEDITDNVMGLALFYGSNDTLNLCSFDSHFEMFVAKTMEVYSSLSDEEKLLIFADEASRRILEDSSSVISQKKISDYSDKILSESKTECAFLSSKAFIDCFLSPLVCYVVESVLSVMSVQYERLPRQKGWFGKGLFNYLIKGNDTIMPYLFIKLSPAHYLANVNNFIEKTNCLSIDIKFDTLCLVISFKDSSAQTEGTFTYAFSPGFAGIIEKKTIMQYGKEIYYNYEEILPDDISDIAKELTNAGITDKLPNDIGDARKFVLPWNQCIVTGIHFPYDNDPDFTENQISYCTLDKDQSTVLTFFENRSSVSVLTEKKISSSKMLFQIYKDNNKDSLNISFDNPGYNSAGTYKDNLQSKVFQFNK